MRTLVLATLLVTLLVANGTGWQPGGPGRPDAGKPLLAFSLEREMGPGANATGWFVMAGWSDGLVVFADSFDKPGAELRAGHITPSEVDRVTSDMQEAGLFEKELHGGSPPDAPNWTLRATREGKKSRAVATWEDGLRRGRLVKEGEAERATAKMWVLCRLALSYARPVDSTALKDDAEAKRRFESAVVAGSLHR